MAATATIDYTTHTASNMLMLMCGGSPLYRRMQHAIQCLSSSLPPLLVSLSSDLVGVICGWNDGSREGARPGWREGCCEGPGLGCRDWAPGPGRGQTSERAGQRAGLSYRSAGRPLRWLLRRLQGRLLCGRHGWLP